MANFILNKNKVILKTKKEEVTMSDIIYFDSKMKMPLMELPLRSTIIKYKNEVIIISPIDFTASQIDEIKKMGTVTTIIAPSLFHHIFVKRIHKIFDSAKIFCVKGLETKRADIKWDGIIDPSNWRFKDEIELILVEGMPKVNEALFLHKPTKTLIVVDLVFNLINARGLGSFIILSLFGTYQKLGISRFFMMLIKDRAAFIKSMQTVLNYDFQKIIMCHGEVINDNGKSVLTHALKARGFI